MNTQLSPEFSSPSIYLASANERHSSSRGIRIIIFIISGLRHNDQILAKWFLMCVLIKWKYDIGVSESCHFHIYQSLMIKVLKHLSVQILYIQHWEERLLSMFQNILSCSQSDTEFRWTSPRCRGRRWRWRYAHCTVRHIRSGTQLPWRHSTAHRGRHLVQWFRKHPAHLSSPHRCVVPTTLQTYDYFWQRIILIPFFVSSKWCGNVG